MTGRPAPFCVIVPAHNEEAVIRRCLNAVLFGADPGRPPEIIVVANGCTDRTVDIAKATVPFATVLDLPTGSKTAAMNAGNHVATVAPRFFLDADIECDFRSLRATADIMRHEGILAATPELKIDYTQCDPWVRAYYRVWTRLPYVRNRLLGSGLYGLSADGLALVGEFPDVIADDLWVRNIIPHDSRRAVGKDASGQEVYFLVRPPRSFREHVKIEERRYRGNRQLQREEKFSGSVRTNGASDLMRLIKSPRSAWDVAIYLTMKSAARALYWLRGTERSDRTWTRDETSRA